MHCMVMQWPVKHTRTHTHLSNIWISLSHWFSARSWAIGVMFYVIILRNQKKAGFWAQDSMTRCSHVRMVCIPYMYMWTRHRFCFYSDRSSFKKNAEGYIRFGHLFIAIPSHIGVAQFTGHKHTKYTIRYMLDMYKFPNSGLMSK